MLSPIVKLFGAGVIVVLVCCLSTTRANASVFRDRAAFNAASQNLRTIDFESLEPSDLPFVKVQAEDQQHHLFDLPCEATARVRDLSWMSQVTVPLPDALAGAGDVNITVTLRGAVSNTAPLRID